MKNRLSSAVSESKNGVYINLHVIPGSSKSVFPAGFNKWRSCIEIKVKSEAKDNKANIEVLNLVSSFFVIPLERIFIVSGKKSREKKVEINNISIDQVQKKIEVALDGL